MPERWLPDELKKFLNVDKMLRILFVEGDSDLRFWHKMVEPSERGETEIYPISRVHLPDGTNGEKGRINHLAGIVSQWEATGRLLFFVMPTQTTHWEYAPPRTWS